MAIGAMTGIGTSANRCQAIASSSAAAGKRMSAPISAHGGAVVKDGGTLKGTSSIGGTLTCEAGAICEPGNSLGTFTVGGLTLMSGSTLEFELGAIRDHIVGMLMVLSQARRSATATPL